MKGARKGPGPREELVKLLASIREPEQYVIVLTVVHESLARIMAEEVQRAGPDPVAQVKAVQPWCALAMGVRSAIDLHEGQDKGRDSLPNVGADQGPKAKRRPFHPAKWLKLPEGP